MGANATYVYANIQYVYIRWWASDLMTVLAQGHKLSQLVDASKLVTLPALPNVVLPKNIQVLAYSDSGNTDTTVRLGSSDFC